MLHISRSFYELKFRLAFLDSGGESFEEFFCRLMELRHPTDFERTKPHGSYGDRKNDGYLRSRKHLFQAYAPEHLRRRDTTDKIARDFEGAKKHWSLKKWSFVHNSLKGLGPHINKLLQDLDEAHPAIEVGSYGYAQMRRVMWDLADIDREALLGPPVVPPENGQIGFDEIKVVVAHVALEAPAVNGALIIPPPDKLDINGFSEDTRELIRFSASHASRVQAFFDTYMPDPELGEKVASALRHEYEELKQQRMSPDEIFSELFHVVSSPERGKDLPALAVLAYFFDACDIFEAVPNP